MPDAPSATPERLDDVEPAGLWLRRGDQFFVGILVVAGIVLLSISWIRTSGRSSSLVEIERLPARQYDYQLDINRASWIEWTLLEGIGEKLAKRIVEYRDQHGRFETLDDLDQVPGIGAKTLEKIRPWLVVTAADTPLPEPRRQHR